MKKIVDMDKFHKYCDECFSRLDTTDHYEQGERIGLIMALDWLNAQPEAEEEKRGKWELNEDGSGTCTRCNTTQKNVWDLKDYQNYCEHRRAKMDLGEEE